MDVEVGVGGRLHVGALYRTRPGGGAMGPGDLTQPFKATAPSCPAIKPDCFVRMPH